MARYRPLPAALNRPIRLAVLISGGGTTLINLAEKIHDKSLNAQIPLVIASRGECGGISRAATWNLPCEVIQAEILWFDRRVQRRHFHSLP